jgi:hypothetical protein
MIRPPPIRIRGMHKICIIKKPFAAELFEGGRSCPGNKLPPYFPSHDVDKKQKFIRFNF